jgi:hypothetical protein
MYTKNQQNSSGVKLTVGALLLILFIGGSTAVLYNFLNKSDSATTAQPATTKTPSSTTGIIAKFNQDGTLSTNNQSGETQEPQTQAAVSFSSLPYTLPLPAGWAEIDSSANAIPCDGGEEVVTKTYKNGQETLIVYENSSPDGCAGTSIADVYLDYDFDTDGSKIIIDDSKISQCSKTDNSSCPKGDGKVSIFIGNEDPSGPNKQIKSTITNKSYFFSITDTKIDSDFTTQVKSLANLLKDFQIN